jgi:hypothetical protein
MRGYVGEGLDANVLFATLHLSAANNLVVVVGIGRLDCLFTDGRQVEVGYEPGCFLRVRAKEHIPDTHIPMVNSELTQGIETLEKCEFLAC